MCLLVNLCLVENSYPAIFELILRKLYHGNIPLPEFGPIVLLNKIGCQYAVHHCSQLIQLEEEKNMGKEPSSLWNWLFLHKAISNHYGPWYEKYKSAKIHTGFSCIPKQGEFLKALKQTLNN